MMNNNARRNRYTAQLVLTRHQEQLINKERLEILTKLRKEFHTDPERILILDEEAPEAAVELAYEYETKVVIARSLMREEDSLKQLIAQLDKKVAACDPTAEVTQGALIWSDVRTVPGCAVRTPRGSFRLAAMTKQEMEAAGYGYHHQTEDGKYIIMGNGTQAFAVKNEEES